MVKPIVITTGEPAGIGPDIALQIALQPQMPPLVLVGDYGLLFHRAQALGLSVSLVPFSPQSDFLTGSVTVEHVPLAVSCIPGQLNVANAPYVVSLLDIASDRCAHGEFSALVTAPVHKGIINQAHIAFSGHTEYLAQRLQAPSPVMLFVGDDYRMALATTHLPLASVPPAITPGKLETTLRILHADLISRFHLTSPYVMVAGLNPHAGEEGYLGDEEITVMGPVINRLSNEGLNIKGPFSADTLLRRAKLEHADAVLMMYHDQGLPALKLGGFGHSVNVTLGLPIIRTSVDHGTALNLAATGKATPNSLLEAVKLAEKLASPTLKQ